jgi:hypothetical protein
METCSLYPMALEVIAVKLIIYPRDHEEYYTFITREALRRAKRIE